MSNVKYFDLSIPATRRLAMMRADFAGHAQKYPHCPAHAKPTTWRSVRGYTHKTWQSAFATLSRGLNDNTPVWCTHNGPEFRDERDADDIVCRLPRGWYTDTDCHDTAIGIVARLTHGRFLAGYRWTSNDERVYFPEVFTDEDDAARAADGHAEWFADQAREDSERFDAVHKAESDLDDAVTRLRECLALRHRACMAYVRDEARELISAVRELRATLLGAQADYERG